MNVKKKESNSNTLLIGEYLKIERESKGISLEYISAQTKINYNILKKLENDNLRDLPNIAYLKGFVQNYNRIINGNLKESLERLDYSYGLKEKNDREVLSPKRAIPIKPNVNKSIGNTRETTLSDQVVHFTDQLISNKKPIVITLVLGLCGFGIYGAYNYINTNINQNISNNIKPLKAVAKESIEIKAKDTNILESDKLKSMRANLKTRPVQEKKVETAKKLEIEKKPEIKEVKVVKNNPSSKFPFYKFRPFRANKVFTILEDAQENSDSALLPTNYKNKIKEGKENVFINAVTDKTWLSYTTNKGKVVTRILKPGQKLFIQGDEIAIFLGNVNATKIFYNNQLIDPKSKTGVKSLIFPMAKTLEYHLPLFKSNTDGVLYKSSEYISKMLPEEKTISN
jgi:cytoskeleton protein RodZ